MIQLDYQEYNIIEHLMHNIHNFYEEFNSKICNNLEHQNLYIYIEFRL